MCSFFTPVFVWLKKHKIWGVHLWAGRWIFVIFGMNQDGLFPLCPVSLLRQGKISLPGSGGSYIFQSCHLTLWKNVTMDLNMLNYSRTTFCPFSVFHTHGYFLYLYFSSLRSFPLSFPSSLPAPHQPPPHLFLLLLPQTHYTPPTRTPQPQREALLI